MKLQLKLSHSNQTFIFDIPEDQQLFSYIGSLTNSDVNFKEIRVIGIVANGLQISPYSTVAELKMKNDQLIVLTEAKGTEAKERVRKLLEKIF